MSKSGKSESIAAASGAAAASAASSSSSSSRDDDEFYSEGSFPGVLDETKNTRSSSNRNQSRGEGQQRNYNTVKAYHSTQPWMILHKTPFLKLAPIKSQADLYEWYHIHFLSFTNSLDKYNRALLMEADTTLTTHADRAFNEILNLVEEQKILDAHNNGGEREVSRVREQAESRRKTIRSFHQLDSHSVEDSLKQVLLDPLKEVIIQRAHDMYQCILNALRLLPLNPTLAMATDISSLFRQSTHPGDLWYRICKAAFIPHSKLVADAVELTYPIEDVRIQITARVREAFAKESYTKGASLTRFAQRLLWYRHAYDQTGQLLTENMVQHHFQHQEGIRKSEQVMRCWARIKAEAEAQQTLKSQAMVIAELLMEEFVEDGSQRRNRLQQFKNRLAIKQQQMDFLEKVQQVEVLLRVEGWSPLEDQMIMPGAGTSSSSASASSSASTSVSSSSVLSTNDVAPGEKDSANYSTEGRSNRDYGRGRSDRRNDYRGNNRDHRKQSSSRDRGHHSSQRGDDQSRVSKSDDLTCFGCSGKGHVSPNCSSRTGSTVRCYNCGGKGHIADDCASRPGLNREGAEASKQQAVEHGKSQHGVDNGKSYGIGSGGFRGRNRRDTPRREGRPYSRSRSRDYSRSRSRSHSRPRNHQRNHSNDIRPSDDAQKTLTKPSSNVKVIADANWGYWTTPTVEYVLTYNNLESKTATDDTNSNPSRGVVTMNRSIVVKQTTLDSFFTPVVNNNNEKEVIVIDSGKDEEKKEVKQQIRRRIQPILISTKPTIAKSPIKQKVHGNNQTFNANSDLTNTVRANLFYLCKVKHLYLSKSQIDGLGVFAKRVIKKGKLIVKYHGEVLDQKQFDEKYDVEPITRVPRRSCRYTFQCGNQFIDASNVQYANFSRWVNHADILDPKNNCIFTRNGYIKAVRDIQPHEELLVDYGPDFWTGANAVKVGSAVGISEELSQSSASSSLSSNVVVINEYVLANMYWLDHPQTILLDSGASISTAKGDVKLLDEIRVAEPRLLSGCISDAKELKLEIRGDRKIDEINERNVWKHDGIARNLTAVGPIVDKGKVVLFSKIGAHVVSPKSGGTAEFVTSILAHSNVHAFFFRYGNLFLHNPVFKHSNHFTKPEANSVNESKVENSPRQVAITLTEARLQKLQKVKLAHESLGHINYDKLKRLTNQCSADIFQLIKFDWSPEEVRRTTPCDGCAVSKQRDRHHNSISGRIRATRPFQQLFMDLSGLIHWDKAKLSVPLQRLHSLFNHWRGFDVVVCSFSSYVFVNMISQKSQGEVTDWRINLIQQQELQLQVKVSHIFIDQGTENLTQKFKEYCTDKGITLVESPTRNKFRQGQVEVYMRIIWKNVEAMLYHANLHVVFAYYAVPYQVYIMDQLPKQKQSISRSHIYYGRPSNYKGIYPFGCDAYVNLPITGRKLEPAGQKAIFLGFNSIKYVPIFLVVEENQPAKIVEQDNFEIFVNRFTFARGIYGHRRVQYLQANNDIAYYPSESAFVTPSVEDATVHFPDRVAVEIAERDLEVSIARKLAAIRHPFSEKYGEDSKTAEALTRITNSRILTDNNPIIPHSIIKLTPGDNNLKDAPPTSSTATSSSSTPSSSSSSSSSSQTSSSSSSREEIETQKAIRQVERAIKNESHSHGKVQSRSERAQRRGAVKDSIVNIAIMCDGHIVETAQGDVQTDIQPCDELLDIINDQIVTVNNTIDSSFDTKEVANPTIPGPANYREYLNESTERKGKWDIAILKEKSAIQAKRAYECIKEEEAITNEDAIIIDSRLVLTEKINELMESVFKARLVAKHIKKRFYGNDVFRDENGNPIDTYAPVMLSKTFRLILILAAIRRMVLHQFDINNAFLNATYKRNNIYIRPPQGYNFEKEGYLWRLLRPLYGMQDAPREWYECFKQFLIRYGFAPVKHFDECLFQYWVEDKYMVLLGFHVDDNISARDRNSVTDLWWEKFLSAIDKEFGIKDLGVPKWCLGINVNVNDKGIHLSQSTYIEKSIQACKITSRFRTWCAELSSNNQLRGSAQRMTSIERNQDKVEMAKQGWNMNYYQVLVGTLLYAALMTRPDIAHVVQLLSRDLNTDNLTSNHFKAALYAFRYLISTAKYGLLYRYSDNASSDIIIECYSDSDFAGDPSNSKSTTGYIIYVNQNVLHWQSKMQKYVSQSTCAAEYIAMSAALVDIIWLKGLLSKLRFKVHTPSLIWGDNAAQISLTNGIIMNQKLRGVRVAYHLLKDEREKGEIEIKWVESKENTADIFTKSLPKQTFAYLRDRIVFKPP